MNLDIWKDNSKGSWYLQFLSFICLFVYLIYFFGKPDFIGNESVYLIDAIRMKNVNLLNSDWALNSKKSSFGILFTLLTQPLFYLSSNTVEVAQILRIVLWLFVTFTLYSLISALKINKFSLFLGLLIFLHMGQGLIAGEWLFGGAEQKVISYGFVFLSLSMLVRKKMAICGLFAGIAFLAHVLVGGWSALSLLVVLAVSQEHKLKSIVRFSLFSVPIALLAIWIQFGHLIALSNPAEVVNATLLGVSKLLVVFRNPHHLDPYYFMGIKETLFSLFFILSVIFCVISQRINKEHRPIFIYLFVLCSFFILGLIARFFDLFSLLQLYPFRVADLLLPLAFSLIAAELIIQFLFIQSTKYITQKKYILFISILISITPLLLLMKHASYYGLKTHKVQEFDRMAAWIKSNVLEDEIILANPCQGDFWIKTERAMVVNIKITPQGVLFNEWYTRMKNLNDNIDFVNKGFQICKEIQSNFNQLNIEKLNKLKNLYGVTYFLSGIERIDLDAYMLYSTGKYHLYKLL